MKNISNGGIKVLLLLEWFFTCKSRVNRKESEI
jgi:hypothetical protein